MPNGTGKTTTLSLLRAALSGGAGEWPEEQVRAFQKKRGTDDQSGTFVVRLAVDKQLITFELTLDFESGKARYRTTFGAGVQKGFRPTPALRRFLTPEFVELFVFDGELATRLLDSRATSARSAVEALFQLPLLRQLASAIERNWEKHANTVSAKQEKGLTQRRNKLSTLEEQLQAVKKRRKVLAAKIPSLEKEIVDLEAKYRTELGRDSTTRDQLATMTQEKLKIEAGLHAAVAKVIDSIRGPQALLVDFASEMGALKQNMDRLKLPRSTSREFFEELCSEHNCICGRALDETTRTAIRDRALTFLAAEEVGVLNGMKTDIATHCGEDPTASKRELDILIQGVSDKVFSRDQVDAGMQAIEAERIARGDGSLEKIKLDVDGRKRTLSELTSELAEIDAAAEGSEGDDTTCLKALELKRAQAKQAVAEATNTVILKKKTEVLTEILISAQEMARTHLKQILLSETNQRIDSLLLREPVELEDIDECLVLKEQAGASVGQTLAVSYAFLATLFGRGDYQLPFVVDSPAGPLDLNVRPEVARLVPKLCKQFVAFTISSERDKFVEPLAKAVSGNVQYMTLFRSAGEMKALYKDVPKAALVESSDGALVSGQDFFARFDLDQEA
jgi:DNA sulfur modification protein DndD